MWASGRVHHFVHLERFLACVVRVFCKHFLFSERKSPGDFQNPRFCLGPTQSHIVTGFLRSVGVGPDLDTLTDTFGENPTAEPNESRSKTIRPYTTAKIFVDLQVDRFPQVVLLHTC